MKFSLEKAPHLSSPKSTRKIMTILSISLLVLGIYAITWYFLNAGINYGVNAILIFVVSVLTSVLCDALWAIPELRNKKVTSVKERFKNWGLKILDSYGYVSGLIFALLLPVGTTLYVVFIGAFVGTFLVKSIFGGFGKNIFNPAITARILVGVSFPSALSTTLGDDVATTISSGASITTATSNLGWTTNLQGISFSNMLMGNYRGTLGETFAFLIILIGVVLIALKVIDWRIPTFYIGSILLTTIVMGLASGLGVYSFEFGLRNVLLGGALFGAVFCLTDPVTSPTSRQGKIIFAVGAALLTCLIRYQASSVEGVGFSIMLMNILAPLIDRLCVSNSDKKIGIKAGTIGGIVALTMVFGGVYGYLNQTSDTYSTTVERCDDHMDLYDIALDISKKNSYGYEVVDEDITLEHGTCLEKINFTLDDEPASYYRLMTDPKDSYNYNYVVPVGTTEGYIEFGIVVNENGVVGYKYIDGTENSLGIEFAEQISITPEYPYTTGNITTSNLIVETGSTAVNSVVTIPAMLKTMQDAELDFGVNITTTSVISAAKEEY